MKHDEFAFLNQQLAGMLKSGIPLEAALRQLCEGMRRGRFRRELELLNQDLSQGVPMEKALAGRKLPELYKQMVQVGVKSNDLPALLNLLADYYQRNSNLWTRLQGLMVYPVIVLFASFALSAFLAREVNPLSKDISVALNNSVPGAWNSGASLAERHPALLAMGVLTPMYLLGLLAGGAALFCLIPSWRRNARWCLPGFKEALLSRLAWSLSMLLKSGCDLGGSLALLARLEGRTRAGRDLRAWETELAAGGTKFVQLREKSRTIPPLFFWLAASEGEDLAAGLARAAEIYYARAVYKTETMLNAMLPVSILALGAIIVVQLFSTFQYIFGSIPSMTQLVFSW